jgi:microsomal dipeptidase-like Zn-dependent dipeptidase
MRSAIAAAAAFSIFLAAGTGAAARTTQLANRCFTAGGDGYSERFYLKPTDLGTYMLYDHERRLVGVGSGGTVTRVDTPGPQTEWSIRRRSRGRFAIASTASGVALGVDPQKRTLALGRATAFTLTHAAGCREYPEAALDARGRPRGGTLRDGTLFGFADAHLHITSDLRGGGDVIYGENFDRFGITEALGHDADVHGDNGSLDITGNLLRSGSPAGTHDTHGWPTFAGWPVYDTYTHQQTYYRWLQRAWMSGLRLVVAQTVEDEPLCNIEPRRSHSCDETASVELQIKRLRALQDYVDAQSGGRGRGWFRLVYDPVEARRVVAQGKLAVVIGIEWSDPFGCSERTGQPNCTRADIDTGIAHLRELGVRALFVAHWVDNALAGAALEGGSTGDFINAMQLEQTGQPFSTGPCPEAGQGVEVPPLPGLQCNTRGLTDLGEYAINRLMDNHMLIEADHLSEWARLRVLSIAEARHYPLVSSHTNTGGLWTASDLKRLYALGGVATARIDDADKLPDTILSFRRFATGPRPVAVGLGSDTGGFNALPGPQGSKLFHYPFRAYHCGTVFDREQTGTKTFDLTKDGVAHYGLVPDLLANVATQPHGKAALGLLDHSAEGYLDMWQRAVGSR